MYNIALCDDKGAELDKVETMLKNYQEEHEEYEFQVERFTSAEEMLRRVRGDEYMPDLLLTDIYMDKKSGIEAAEELRDMGSDCRIIFLSVSREHAMEAFGVYASHYLVKPVSQEKFFTAMDLLLKDIKEERKRYLILQTKGRINRVALWDILYLEAQKRCQQVYLADGDTLTLRMTMTSLFEILSEYQEFVKVGAAYIVNLEHVKSLNAQEIKIDNGDAVHLPRGAYQVLREQYFDFYCRDQ